MYYLNKMVPDSEGYKKPVTVAARQTISELAVLEIEMYNKGINLRDYFIQEMPGKLVYMASITKGEGEL